MLQTIAIVAGLFFSLTASAQNKQISSGKKIEPLPRDLEIQLALSALPPHLRDNATVYVLNPDKGFEVARQGTNGFHAFVARTGDDTFRGSWPLKQYRDDILYPISLDEAGSKAQMRVFFDAAEMQAKGTPPEELKKIIQQRYKTHSYNPPERAGVSYMLSPILRTYVNPDQNDVALATLSICLSSSAAAPSESTTARSAAVRDGSHDFDFIYGKWRMPNHHLKKRLAGSREWDDFVTCDEGSPLPGGIGNIDYWKASYWKDFVGVTVRTYDPKTGLWRIYWVDNTFSGGVIQPPVVGKFEGHVWIFEGPDTFNGTPILVRYTWTVNPNSSQVQAKREQALNPKGSQVIAKWEQAFSTDNGKTWETNWYNEFIHDDNCTPTP